MILPQFSINGSPHQRIHLFGRGRQPAPAGGPATVPDNVIPSPPQGAPIEQAAGNFGQRMMSTVFKEPTGLWSTLAWPVTTSWRLLGFTAGEAVGAIPDAMTKIGDATKWSARKTLGSQEAGTEGLVPNVAKRGFNWIKEPIVDGGIRNIIGAGRAAIYSTLSWMSGLPRDMLMTPRSLAYAVEWVRFKIADLGLDILKPFLKALKLNKLLAYGDRVTVLAQEMWEGILDPFRNTADMLGRKYDIGADIVLEAARAYSSGHAGLLSPRLKQAVNEYFRVIANQPDLIFAMKESRDTVGGWMRGSGFLRRKGLHPRKDLALGTT